MWKTSKSLGFITSAAIIASSISLGFAYSSGPVPVRLTKFDSQGRHSIISDTGSDPMINLGRSEKLGIIYNNGTTDIIVGPFSGRLSQATRARAEDFSPVRRIMALFSQYSNEQSLGAIRGSNGEALTLAQGVNAKDVSLESNINQCYSLGSPPRLWRSNSTGAESIILTYLNGPTVTIRFDAGQSFAQWPAGFGLSEDNTYMILYPENPRARTKALKLKELINEGEASPLAYMEKGCDLQAELSVRSITHH